MMVLITVVLVVIILVAVVYNRLVRDRNRVDSAWSDIDVQLQRRHDLIPQLVTAVDQYANYERATLEAVTSLRAAAVQVTDVAEKSRAEEELSNGVSRLIALAEKYPDLKASDNFLKLQRDLVETENYLQFARRYYNGSVREFNTRVETVPSNFVAGWFGFSQRDFFQKESDEVAAVPLVNLVEVE